MTEAETVTFGIFTGLFLQAQAKGIDAVWAAAMAGWNFPSKLSQAEPGGRTLQDSV